jgi:hypothetical protein
MPLMTAADCIAFCVLVASAVWIAAIWVLKGVGSESERKIESKESDPCWCAVSKAATAPVRLECQNAPVRLAGAKHGVIARRAR